MMHTPSRPDGRRGWKEAWQATWQGPRDRGAAGPLGMIAVFFACALLLTVIMLFATGVAQRGILPRLHNRSTAAVTITDAPVSADAAQASNAVPEEVAGSPGAVDSLLALKQQVRVEQQRLQERIDRMAEVTTKMEEARDMADGDADKRIADLAKIYSSMKPQSAAMVMVNLDDSTFQMVLAKLKTRQAAKILSYVDPVRVARLTQEQAISASETARPRLGER